MFSVTSGGLLLLWVLMEVDLVFGCPFRVEGILSGDLIVSLVESLVERLVLD